VVYIIHLRTRHVSVSILIGRNSVAERLMVATTYHLNSDPKWPALWIPISVWLWLQSVRHTKCGLCPLSPPSVRFMISLILSQKLWINSILELFFYSCTMNISDIVNWRPGSERGSVYAWFMYRILCDQNKSHGLKWTWIDWSYPVEGIFPVANMLALATETIETYPNLDQWELAKRCSIKFEL